MPVPVFVNVGVAAVAISGGVLATAPGLAASQAGGAQDIL